MKNFIFLIVGATVGSGVTFFITRDRYERKLKAEREKMVEEVNEIKSKEDESKDEVLENQISIDDINKKEGKVSDLISSYKSKDETVDINLDRVNFYKDGHLVKSLINEENNNPYIISHKEFDTKGYETRYWYLYSDDVLTDEDGNVVTTQEIEYSLGDCLNINWNNWDDEHVIHIRNDNDETDYEIKRVDHDYIEEREDDEL